MSADDLVCRADGSDLSSIDSSLMELPVSDETEALALLEQIGGGASLKELAEWAVNERRKITCSMRLYSSYATFVIGETRDNVKYGPGGRTPENLYKRAVSKDNLAGGEAYKKMVHGSSQSNEATTQAIRKGSKYLKHGGKVIIVVSVSITAYTLMTTPEEDMERVLHEDVGGAVGGAIGTGLAVGACIAFGVATAGWGLLACGVVGGLAGGIGGSYLGDKIYYQRHPGELILNQDDIFQLDGSELVDTIDACYAPL